MDDQLPGNADRYTMLTHRSADDLASIGSACRTLGLSWFAMGCEDATFYCGVYIFFDRQGMKNYMNGLYAKEG